MSETLDTSIICHGALNTMGSDASLSSRDREVYTDSWIGYTVLLWLSIKNRNFRIAQSMFQQNIPKDSAHYPQIQKSPSNAVRFCCCCCLFACFFSDKISTWEQICPFIGWNALYTSEHGTLKNVMGSSWGLSLIFWLTCNLLGYLRYLPPPIHPVWLV